MQRRSYWLINDTTGLVFVHYLPTRREYPVEDLAQVCMLPASRGAFDSIAGDKKTLEHH